ncbi:MAG: T9SS type A sorting domain-containing protein [Bacteroidetes bacterium]|nr:T9SS type A sorting domain-containing protein [Bacteroidota bacterium]
MKNIFATVVCLFSAIPLLAQPSYTGGTGQIGYNLSSYGRVRVGTFPFTSSGREIDRISFIAAQSSDMVFDYNNDADSTSYMAQVISIAGVDTASESMADNEYSGTPPKILVKTAVLAWNDQKYIIVRFRVIADTANLGSLYYGAVVVPRIDGIYGGESVKYNSDKKTTVLSRDGTASFWGIKLLSTATFGVSIKDWDEYSPDPDNDEATDSTRELMTKFSGFDKDLVAGSDGSIISINAGKSGFSQVGDSVTIYYAVAYGKTENEMFSAMDAASAKYSAITSVRQNFTSLPENYSLKQNYPNPFNPETQIAFSIPVASNVSLKIFDALGREVETLVNKTLEAGNYSAPFSASHLSSGMYFYTLQAGSFRETKKMILTK